MEGVLSTIFFYEGKPHGDKTTKRLFLPDTRCNSEPFLLSKQNPRRRLLQDDVTSQVDIRVAQILYDIGIF